MSSISLPIKAGLSKPLVEVVVRAKPEFKPPQMVGSDHHLDLHIATSGVGASDDVFSVLPSSFVFEWSGIGVATYTAFAAVYPPLGLRVKK
jgi:hypothetical protein